MRIAAVLCMSAAFVLTVSTAFGLWTLTRSRTDDPGQLVLRAVAPSQLAAAVMLVAGAVVALAGPPHGAAVLLVICVVGAVGTVAAGSWQGARYAVRRQTLEPAQSGCGGCTCSRCH